MTARPPRRVQVVLLVEGRDDERFLRACLESLSRVRHVDRVLFPPPGSGSGEQYVREQFPAEVSAWRRSHVAEALIVMTDADTLGVEQRRRMLERELQGAGETPRADDERIVLLVPRRNLETWVAHLNGAVVDEGEDYKPRPPDDFKLAGKKLRPHLSHSGPDCCPPSLQDAKLELRRLEKD